MGNKVFIMYIIEKMVFGIVYYDVMENGNPDQYVVRCESLKDAQAFIDEENNYLQNDLK
jgi:hypothetical protein